MATINRRFHHGSSYMCRRYEGIGCASQDGNHSRQCGTCRRARSHIWVRRPCVGHVAQSVPYYRYIAAQESGYSTSVLMHRRSLFTNNLAPRDTSGPPPPPLSQHAYAGVQQYCVASVLNVMPIFSEVSWYCVMPLFRTPLKLRPLVCVPPSSKLSSRSLFPQHTTTPTFKSI